jgi:tRNA (guanine37-N1)-methyltransferase
VRIDVLTLFPEMFASPLQHSILGRAREAGLLRFDAVNIRDYTDDRHRIVDDAPFGGGVGMVMKAEPLFRAVEASVGAVEGPGPGRVILVSPSGQVLSQALVRELAMEDHLLILCGRYEGLDERVHEHLVTDEISIGDYVLTGGELAAMVLIDAVVRLLPGVLGKAESAEAESFSENLLEYPQYTRPAAFRGWRVPDVLLSGDHEAVRRWRRRESLLRTLARRPDLFRRHILTSEDRELLGFPKSARRKRSNRRADAPDGPLASAEADHNSESGPWPPPAGEAGP